MVVKNGEAEAEAVGVARCSCGGGGSRLPWQVACTAELACCRSVQGRGSSDLLGVLPSAKDGGPLGVCCQPAMPN
ncbi:hypothetical protein V6N11_020806 [Hibiscus sabdariffa]|uniref:Uncharacterized protein n=1 Tax=Hibiscus sabdariffa TaxID=183260 RepID=A0ABR2Q9I4_9ROSI